MLFLHNIKTLIMKLLRFAFPILALSLAVSCSTMKKTQTLQPMQSAVSDAYAATDYEQTLASYDKLASYEASRGSTPDLAYLKMAAKAAYELERYPRAEQLLNNWLEQSKDEEAVLMLGEVYSNTNQTAKEQAHWDKYLALLKSDEARLEILSRQFKMEVKNREYQKALDLWEQMPPTSSPELLYLRAEALKATGKKEEADKIVDGILDRNPGFEQALFWRASDIYTKAEEWYQSEMGKYNKKPDYTSYVYLRRELKKISELFRQSREMFEALRVIDPTNTTYIKYLKNIYLRLEMKEDAVKMDMLLSSQN